MRVNTVSDIAYAKRQTLDLKFAITSKYKQFFNFAVTHYHIIRTITLFSTPHHYCTNVVSAHSSIV